MKKLILLLLLVIFTNCKDYYLEDLINTQDTLEMTQNELDAAYAELDDIYIDFDNVSDSHQLLIEESVESIALGIILDAHRYGHGIISFNNFKLSFNYTGGLANGAFCSSGGDIPIEINAGDYLNLSVQRRSELILHETGHSLLNYLHPQDIQTFHPGFASTEGGPIEIMDADLWMPSLAHYIIARERFWSGEGQYSFPCSGKGSSTKFTCRTLIQ